MEVYKHDPDPDQLDIKDGQEFAVEGVTLKAVFTPGHTTDHMAFVFKEEDSMFTGDSMFFNAYHISETGSVHFFEKKLLT